MALSSPKLKGVVSRLFSDSDFKDLLSVYAEAMSNGGSKELDFAREAGVSFNPRPARVALIQLNEAEVLDLDTLKTNILHSSHQAVSDPDLVKVFHWLDRARHAHLSDEKHRLELVAKLLEESHSHLEQASIFAVALVDKIKLWQTRAPRFMP